MAYIKEWERDLQKKKTKDLLKVQDALNILIDEWELFSKEYPEIKVLRSLVYYELEIRK